MMECGELSQAVNAALDDDLPRLVYADWLEEQGQCARAEFIRVQIASARAEPFSPAARMGEARASTLLQSHESVWTHHLPRSISSPRFRRGFIEHIAADPVAAVDWIEEVAAMEPIQSLQVNRHPGAGEWLSLEPVFEMPRMEQIRSLELSVGRGGFSHDEYAAILKSPRLRGIRQLSLRGNALQPAWLTELFEGDSLANLEACDFSDIAHLGPGLLAALTRASQRSLRMLNLSGVMFTSNDLQRSLRCPCLKEVQELRLGYSGRGEPGPLFYLDIGWSLPWQQLRVLDLGGQRLGDDAVRAITSQQESRSLRWLGLADNHLGLDSLRRLLAAKHLALYYLDLRGNGFKPEMLRLLQERFPEAVVIG